MMDRPGKSLTRQQAEILGKTRSEYQEGDGNHEVVLAFWIKLCVC